VEGNAKPEGSRMGGTRTYRTRTTIVGKFYWVAAVYRLFRGSEAGSGVLQNIFRGQRDLQADVTLDVVPASFVRARWFPTENSDVCLITFI
jgi:hypothetical protein